MQRNESWSALCNMTRAIVAESREAGALLEWRAAFLQAVRQRPDLAKTAICPEGERLTEAVPEVAAIVGV